MKHKITTLFILTFIMFIGSGCIPPGPDSKKCEPKWFSKRQTGEGIIYGVGLGETSNRRVTKDLSWSSAASDVNTQIRSRVINEVEANFNEVYAKTVDGETARKFTDGVESNLYSKTDRVLDGCITQRFVDCESNGVWSAYTEVKFDLNGWKKTILRDLLDEEISKASDEIKAQSDEFHKRMGID